MTKSRYFQLMWHLLKHRWHTDIIIVGAYIDAKPARHGSRMRIGVFDGTDPRPHPIRTAFICDNYLNYEEEKL